MSHPGNPSNPGPLDQAEQQKLIQQIGRSIVGTAPPGWDRMQVEYRAVGPHSELVAELFTPNGIAVPLATPPEAAELFARLRRGMYEPERGTWVSALYRLQRPGSFTIDFNGEHEPSWRTAPTAADLADERRAFPRAPQHVPGWLAPDLAAALRTAVVFEESPTAPSRAGLGHDERDRVLRYLESAPIVLAARGFDADRLDPAHTRAVPMTFHTDGQWIWPGAVGYYLRAHGLAPESDLVQHIRSRSFAVPQVDDSTRERAVAVITGR